MVKVEKVSSWAADQRSGHIVRQLCCDCDMVYYTLSLESGAGMQCEWNDDDTNVTNRSRHSHTSCTLYKSPIHVNCSASAGGSPVAMAATAHDTSIIIATTIVVVTIQSDRDSQSGQGKQRVLTLALARSHARVLS